MQIFAKAFAALVVLSALLGCAGGSSFGSGGSKQAGAAEKPEKKAEKKESDQTAVDEEEEDAPEPEEKEAEDLPVDEAQDDVLAPIDSFCANGGRGRDEMAPKLPPLPRTVPADCRRGIEFNNFEGRFELTAKSGSRSLKLEVDIASYLVSDRMRILARSAKGERVILDTCRLSTANYVDPTDGRSRPPEDSVREFRVTLPKGTTSLTFDFGEADSPTYMKVTGLCDFTLTPGGDAELRAF